MNIIKLVLISTLFVPVLVFAQNQATLPGAGLTPESSFYFIDKLGEALREFFTFNPEGKARLQINFAAERVAEIKVIFEEKGVDAKGLEIAQSRLQAHLANAATIVLDQKSEGKDVSALAKELGDDFEGPKSVLEQTFKEQKRTLEAQEKELKRKIFEARQANNTAEVESLVQQLGQVKAQKELLELKEEKTEEALEQEEERLEEEMEAKEEAEKAIREAEKDKEEILSEIKEKNIEMSAETFSAFDSFLSQAKIAFGSGNYDEAKRLAKEAKENLKNVENGLEQLKDVKEKEDELKQESDEQHQEVEEKLKEANKEEAEELKKEEAEKEAEHLEKEREKAEEEAKKAEEKLRESGSGDED